MKKLNIPTSKQGLKKHKGPVNIPSNHITMEGIPYPVLGIADNGQTQVMQPDQNYMFDGASNVLEIPMHMINQYMQQGGTVQHLNPSVSNEPKNYEDLRMRINQKNRERLAQVDYMRLTNLPNRERHQGGSKSREREREKQDGGLVSILPENVEQAVITPNGRYIQLLSTDAQNKPREPRESRNTKESSKDSEPYDGGKKQTTNKQLMDKPKTVPKPNMKNNVPVQEDAVKQSQRVQNSTSKGLEINSPDIKKNPYLFPIQSGGLDINMLSNNNHRLYSEFYNLSSTAAQHRGYPETDNNKDITNSALFELEGIVKQNRTGRAKGLNQPVTAKEMMYFLRKVTGKDKIYINELPLLLEKIKKGK